MNYVRQTINSDKLLGIVYLPISLVNRTMKIFILPLEADNFVKSRENPEKSASGYIAKYANPDLIDIEQNAWENAARGEYGVAC
jgi:hypothetical protein